MRPGSISPRFVRFTDVIVPLISLLIAAGLVGVSIWGFRVCRSLALLGVLPPGSGVNHLVEVLSWLILFAPLGLLGLYFLRSALTGIYVSRQGVRTAPGAEVVILPPQIARVSTPAPASAPAGEPLDEATARRLDQLGERAARIVNVGAGLLFLISGLCGFFWAGTYSYHAFRGQVHPFVWGRGLLLCGFLVFLGFAILRDTFKKADTAWLIPLKIFTGVASRRVELEEMARRNKDKAGTE